MIFFSSVRHYLRPLLVPTITEDPATIIFYFKGKDTNFCRNYNIDLREFAIHFFKKKVMKYCCSWDAIIKQSKDKIPLRCCSSMERRHTTDKVASMFIFAFQFDTTYDVSNNKAQHNENNC